MISYDFHMICWVALCVDKRRLLLPVNGLPIGWHFLQKKRRTYLGEACQRHPVAAADPTNFEEIIWKMTLIIMAFFCKNIAYN